MSKQSDAKRTLALPCGNGKRIRSCHREQIKDLREKIAPALAAESLRSLLSA